MHESGKIRELQVYAEVRNALQSVESAAKKMASERKARDNAEIQLQGEKDLFDSACSSRLLLFQRENALVNARNAEIGSQIEYNKALATLQQNHLDDTSGEPHHNRLTLFLAEEIAGFFDKIDSKLKSYFSSFFNRPRCLIMPQKHLLSVLSHAGVVWTAAFLGVQVTVHIAKRSSIAPIR